MIRPQVSHKTDFIASLCEPRNIPYVVIDKDVYGKMDGATVMKLALVTYKKHSDGKIKINKKRRLNICLLNLKHL